METRYVKTEKKRNLAISLVLPILIILLAVGAGYFYLAADEDPAPPVEAGSLASTRRPPAPEPPPPPAPPAEPEPPPILHPIEPVVTEEPLPAPDESDLPFGKALEKAIGQQAAGLVLSGESIHRFVAAIDNLPRKHLPARIVPLKRAESAFLVDGKEGKLVIDARNARRYAAHVAAAEAIDSAKLVDLYRRFYPLFQRAYQEIGYPTANFNDRLVVAIDDLLAAPDPQAPVRLAQPRVLYEYAGPGLENRSAGQKIMMRIGRKNAAILKAKLREIRGLVAY
jgi:hypothetical protein